MEQDELAEVIPLDESAKDYMLNMPDEVIRRISFVMPWQYDSDDGTYIDPDKKKASDLLHGDKATRDSLQTESWNKFNKNPQVSSAIRDQVGRITGLGFGAASGNFEVDQAIQEIEFDPRNRLYNYWPKWVGRTFIEGELFLSLTLHLDGFVEVDFNDPSELASKGDDNTGIIFHPNKTFMPLFYLFGDKTGQGNRIVPSIFVGMFPELAKFGRNHKDFNEKFLVGSNGRGRRYAKIGGFKRFIISWDRGFMTRRNISYLRTILEWLNHYEQLKKYEIDHKKSSGAYMWVFQFEDARAFKLWLSLSDTERRKTSILAKKTPGGSLVLPPGMSVTAVNPNLTSIKEQDTDILQMVASGLNVPEDVMTGTSKGTFASVKASRGPMSDRTSDEIAYFSRFYIHDFWGSIFFLKSAIGTFPRMIKVRKAIDFKDQEPVFKNIAVRPEFLVEPSFPVSEMIDLESRARGLLGVKHGPVSESLGVPNSDVASRMGVGGYAQARLQKATEDEKYPELVFNIDAESLQETIEGEPSASSNQQTKNPKLRR